VKKLTQDYVVKMHPKTPIFRRSPRIVIAQKGYAIITREGIEFVRKRYSCSVALDPGEIKLYEFLIRLLSFGGMLPLALIRKWRESEILKKAQEKHYVTVTISRLELPKKKVQDVVKEIWGNIPKGIYV
jgi:hypothetical protein